MKTPRNVIVMLEVKTNLSLKDLKNKAHWQKAVGAYPPDVETGMEVIQVSANVVQPVRAEKD